MMKANAVANPYPIMPLAMGGEPATSDRTAALWRYIGRLSLALIVLAAFYPFYIVTSKPENFIDWINTLASTVLSVFAALVIGLLLYTFQTRENDRKEKDALTRLLRSELLEVKEMIEGSRSIVPDEALERGVSSSETRAALHFAHPLIVEEAVRSGLFDEQQTTEMLRLARNMRAHQVRVQDLTTTNFWTHMYKLSENSPLGIAGHREMGVRYAEVARTVQRSEEWVLEG